MTEDAVLERAANILAARKKQEVAEVRRLYERYAHKRASEPQGLGKPKKLSQLEALLLVALERRHYAVEAEAPNDNRWHGDVTCVYSERNTATVVLVASRLELLWALWANVSGQNGDTIILNEAHLKGNLSLP